MKFSIGTDEITLLLLETIVFCLQKYFGYGEEAAVAAIEAYYHHETFVDEDFIHHQGPFHIAVRIHFFLTLKGDRGQFEYWRLENNLWHVPPDALGYFLKPDDQL